MQVVQLLEDLEEEVATGEYINSAGVSQVLPATLSVDHIQTTQR